MKKYVSLLLLLSSLSYATDIKIENGDNVITLTSFDSKEKGKINTYSITKNKDLEYLKKNYSNYDFYMINHNEKKIVGIKDEILVTFKKGITNFDKIDLLSKLKNIKSFKKITNDIFTITLKDKKDMQTQLKSLKEIKELKIVEPNFLKLYKSLK